MQNISSSSYYYNSRRTRRVADEDLFSDARAKNSTLLRVASFEASQYRISASVSAVVYSNRTIKMTMIASLARVDSGNTPASVVDYNAAA